MAAQLCSRRGGNKPDEIGPTWRSKYQGQTSCKEREAPPAGDLLGHSAEAADTGVRDHGQFIICSGLKMGQAQAVLFRGLQSVVVTIEPSRHITRM